MGYDPPVDWDPVTRCAMLTAAQMADAYCTMRALMSCVPAEVSEDEATGIVRILHGG